MSRQDINRLEFQASNSHRSREGISPRQGPETAEL